MVSMRICGTRRNLYSTKRKHLRSKAELQQSAEFKMIDMGADSSGLQ